MKIGVVGSTGVIGGIISEHLYLSGNEIVSFSRRDNSSGEYLDVLNLDLKPNFANLDLVIYCSWATNNRSNKCQYSHALAARHWAKIASKQQCKFLFLSSVLAGEAAKSNYGRNKLLAESGVNEFGGKSLRLGLVADDAYDLLLTKLRRIDRKIGIVHRFCDFQTYAISTTSLMKTLLQIVEEWPEGTLYWVAPLRAESLARMVRPNSKIPVGKFSLFRLVPRLVAKLPTRSGRVSTYVDGLKGLLSQNPHPLREDMIVPLDIDDSDWESNLFQEVT